MFIYADSQIFATLTYMQEPVPGSAESEDRSSSTPVEELQQIKAESTEAEDRTQYRVLTLENYRERAEHEQGLMPLKFESDEVMRAFYVERTEELMDQMARREVDTVVYLDKSARPISWFVREFWPVFMKDEKMPETKFANIDANALMKLGPESPRPTDEDIQEFSFSAEQIEELRDIFTDPSTGKSFFDGKKVLIVDEIFVSGSSLKLAQKLFETVFPNAEFSAIAWMYPGFQEDRRMSRRVIEEVPVWYHKGDEFGRGVGDSEDGHFLSRRFEAPDQLGLQLRKEIKQLAKDVCDGVQPIHINPDKERSGRYEGMRVRQAAPPQRRPLFDI